MEHGNETTERDISWLDLLIARERAEGLDGPRQAFPAFPMFPGRRSGAAGASPVAGEGPDNRRPPFPQS